MIATFTEFSTDASFIIGTGIVLKDYSQSRLLKHYTFIWTKEKAISVAIDGVPLKIPAHHLVALTPNQHLQVFETELEHFTVYQFNRDFYCIKDHDKEVSCVGLLFFGIDAIPLIPLDKKEQQSFLLLHHIFLEEFENKDTIQAEMLRMLLARFIIKATRLLKLNSDKNIPNTSGTELLRNFNFLVETHFKESHSVSFYAEKLHKSPKTLSNTFTKYHKSPLQIIHDRIILEAKRQMIYTDKTTKQIAFDVGFEDPSHLSRMFKKVTKQSPSQFKKGITKT